MCPWGQTLPYVIAANPLVRGKKERLLMPVIHFRDGGKVVERELWGVFAPFAASRRHHRTAVTLAREAQERFRRIIREAGSEALKVLEDTGAPGIVLVGRSYNIGDRGINLSIPEKLRSLYGINVIPLDFLPLDGIEIDDITPNMFWNNGRRILQGARFTATRPWLHLIYITNFMCGPDSYLKQFAQEISAKPFLTLQFDAHGNDAGMLTRCEAYLDSKGVLQWWQKNALCRDELSTFPECATAAAAPLPLHSALRGSTPGSARKRMP
jgi:predicted nucleotide-binding protein (sugar kinase/HSP70/actin superfamily)